MKITLSSISTEDLASELAARQTVRAPMANNAVVEKALQKVLKWANSPVGVWEVTTEGDCEGRTVTRLGVYTGHIVDIAFSLADRAMYALQFDKAEMTIPAPPLRYTPVEIALDSKSGTWDISGDDRAEVMRRFLANHEPSTSPTSDYTLDDNKSYAGIRLIPHEN